MRHAFYDGRLEDLGTGAPASFIPLISANWTNNFTWQGVGPMPQAEREKLRRIIVARRARRRAEGALLGDAGPRRARRATRCGASCSPRTSTTSTPTTSRVWRASCAALTDAATR